MVLRAQSMTPAVAVRTAVTLILLMLLSQGHAWLH